MNAFEPASARLRDVPTVSGIEILIVDPSVAGADALLAGRRPDVEVVRLAAGGRACDDQRREDRGAPRDCRQRADHARPDRHVSARAAPPGWRPSVTLLPNG